VRITVAGGVDLETRDAVSRSEIIKEAFRLGEALKERKRITDMSDPVMHSFPHDMGTLFPPLASAA
jgi:hypothetical protein